MNKKSQDSNRPSHAIWQVKGEGDNQRWNRVGAAWMHKESKGANLIFDSIPLNGRVVLREITEQDRAADEVTPAAEGGAQ